VLRLSRTFRFLVQQERQDCDVSAGQRTNYYSDAPETFRGAKLDVSGVGASGQIYSKPTSEVLTWCEAD
jgi:hypothetical protein